MVRLVALKKLTEELEEELIELEEAKLALEWKYKTLLENLNEGIWYIDEFANHVYANKKMLKMLGYTQKEMEGKNLLNFCHPDWVENATLNIDRRKQGIQDIHEFVFKRKDGSSLLAILTTSPVYDIRGTYIGAIAGVIDIKSMSALFEKYREITKYD